MTTQAWIQLIVYLGLLLLLGWPLGQWLTCVAEGRLPRWIAPFEALERGLYRLAGIGMGLIVIVMIFVKQVWLAAVLLVIIGGLAGFFVVPMNALLQHRGHHLWAPGARSRCRTSTRTARS